MRILHPVTEDEVLAAFVRGELESPRWGERVRKLVERAGDNPRAVLAAHRSWPDQGLFHGFPREVDWFRAAVAPSEVLDILYIDWDWWLHISGGTRLPREAARLLRAGAVAGVTLDHEREERIARDAATNPELIAVRLPGSYLVLLEGHVRLTAYALFPEYLPQELEVYVGESPEMTRWVQY